MHIMYAYYVTLYWIDYTKEWVIAHNTRVGVVYLTYTTLRMCTICATQFVVFKS